MWFPFRYVVSEILVTILGMAADPVTIQRIQRSGMGIILPREGMATLSSILMASQQMHGFDAKWSAVPIDWSILLQKACLPHL